MSRSTWRVCTHPECSQLVAGGGRCRRHRAKDNRPSAAARGYDSRWQRTRGRFLRDHPSCEHCGSPATEAHHRDGAGPRGPRGHDLTNLAALCKPCHSRVTAEMQPGGWARDGMTPE